MLPDFSRLKATLDFCAIDIETTPINEFNDIEKIWCISMATSEFTKTVHWKSGITKEELRYICRNVDTMKALGNHNLGTEIETISFMVHLLKGDTTFTPCCHGTFDVRHLGECTEVSYYIDTMLAAYVAFPPSVLGATGDEDALRFYSLAHLSSLGLCKAKLDYDGNFTRYSEKLREYNIQDAISCRELAEFVMPSLFADLHSFNAFVLDMKASQAVIMMESSGIKINQDALLDLTLKTHGEFNSTLDEMRKLVPCVANTQVKPKAVSEAYAKKHLVKNRRNNVHPLAELGKLVKVGESDDTGRWFVHEITEFDPNRDGHVIAYFRHTCDGWTPDVYSKKGNVVLDKNVVNKLAFEYPSAQLLQRYRILEKLLSTYLKPYQRTDKEGRIYPSFPMCATRTGRLASRKPNFQNVPRGDIRKLIVAAEKHKIVCVDLSQIELRILAYDMATMLPSHVASKDSMWIAFAKDADIHAENAKLTGKERKAVKVGIFLYIYGGTVNRMEKSLHMSKAEAKDFFDALEAKIPALPAIKRLMNKRAELEKTLRTVYGHKIVYPDLHRDDIPKWRIAKARRQYFNARIQGSQADIIKLCMWASYKLCLKYGASMLIQVHDELVFEVPEANAALFCDALLPVFNNTKLLPGLNTKGTPGIGNNWYEAKEDAENRE